MMTFYVLNWKYQTIFLFLSANIFFNVKVEHIVVCQKKFQEIIDTPSLITRKSDPPFKGDLFSDKQMKISFYKFLKILFLFLISIVKLFLLFFCVLFFDGKRIK